MLNVCFHQPTASHTSLFSTPVIPRLKMRPSPELAQLVCEKKALYCRSIDTKKWHLLDQVMLPDVKWKTVNADGSPQKEGMETSFSSKDAFVAYFDDVFQPLQTIHVLGPAEMAQLSPDEIKCIFAVQWSSGPKGESPRGHVYGGGHYHEVWRRVGDDWLMAECVLESTYSVLSQQ